MEGAEQRNVRQKTLEVAVNELIYNRHRPKTKEWRETIFTARLVCAYALYKHEIHRLHISLQGWSSQCQVHGRKTEGIDYPRACSINVLKEEIFGIVMVFPNMCYTHLESPHLPTGIKFIILRIWRPHLSYWYYKSVSMPKNIQKTL